MSFRVLVIPEDPTYNGYILKPLAERMLAETGKPQARVALLTNPKLGGIEEAKAAVRGKLVEAYGHFDLWLFLPDADRASGLDELEKAVAARGVRLFCCAARPEVEAWLLAGHRDKLGLAWSEVVRHPRLKEGVFEPFLAAHGDPRRAGRADEGDARQLPGTAEGMP
ncbi:MAG: hypothetical protein FJ272_06150 [Planctomycetes bacterium]|nr:hypothetical protein [Planctomycetota bacterium]MBM4084354.1 hypothetical protein [Planctomycetota bacterium]